MPPKRTAAPTHRVTKPKVRQSSSLSRKIGHAEQPKTKTSALLSTLSDPIATNMAPSSKEQHDKSSGPVYFWKPDQGHGYLGQWFWSPWTHEGDEYKTAEMWMMVGKARLFGDEEMAKQILATDNPKTQKALGRKVRDFDEKTWDENKMRIVEEGSYHKFTISEEAESLRAMLLATGERELVEASPRDRIWGVGFAEKNAGLNRAKWGKNLLGKALMRIRERLREEEGEEKSGVGEEEKE